MCSDANGASRELPVGDDKTLGLALACNSCQMSGTVVSSLKFPSFTDILGDPSDLDLVRSTTLSLVFNGVSAEMDLDVTASADGTFALNLFKTETPLGVAVGLPLAVSSHVLRGLTRCNRKAAIRSGLSCSWT